ELTVILARPDADQVVGPVGGSQSLGGQQTARVKQVDPDIFQGRLASVAYAVAVDVAPGVSPDRGRFGILGRRQYAGVKRKVGLATSDREYRGAGGHRVGVAVDRRGVALDRGRQ